MLTRRGVQQLNKGVKHHLFSSLWVSRFVVIMQEWVIDNPSMQREQQMANAPILEWLRLRGGVYQPKVLLNPLRTLCAQLIDSLYIVIIGGKRKAQNVNNGGGGIVNYLHNGVLTDIERLVLRKHILNQIHRQPKRAF